MYTNTLSFYCIIAFFLAATLSTGAKASQQTISSQSAATEVQNCICPSDGQKIAIFFGVATVGCCILGCVLNCCYGDRIISCLRRRGWFSRSERVNNRETDPLFGSNSLSTENSEEKEPMTSSNQVEKYLSVNVDPEPEKLHHPTTTSLAESISDEIRDIYVSPSQPNIAVVTTKLYEKKFKGKGYGSFYKRLHLLQNQQVITTLIANMPNVCWANHEKKVAIIPSGHLYIYNFDQKNKVQADKIPCIDFNEAEIKEKALGLDRLNPEYFVWSPDDKYIAQVSDYKVNIIDPCSDKASLIVASVNIEEKDKSQIQSFCWSADSARLYLSDRAKCIYVFEISPPKPKKLFTPLGKDREKFFFKEFLHTSQNKLILFPEGGTTEPALYELDSDQQDKQIRTLDNNIARTCIDPSLSPDGKYLVCYGDEGDNRRLIVWDYETGKQCKKFFFEENMRYGWKEPNTLLITSYDIEGKSISIYKIIIEKALNNE